MDQTGLQEVVSLQIRVCSNPFPACDGPAEPNVLTQCWTHRVHGTSPACSTGPCVQRQPSLRLTLACARFYGIQPGNPEYDPENPRCAVYDPPPNYQ